MAVSFSEYFNSSGLRAAASVIVQGTLIDVPDWQSVLTAQYSGHFHKGENTMSSPTPSRNINEKKMQEFLGKVMTDFGASLSSTLAYIGQKLGLYKALANGGPMDEKHLAETTG